MFWVSAEEVAPQLDRIADLGPSSRVMDRDYEYRLIWDGSVGKWRMDRRRTAEGG